jgi:hypothetical protein
MTTVAEILDLSIKGHMKAARAGDPDASSAIHHQLANAIRKDKLTPYMRKLLADMHQSIGDAIEDGTPVDAATLAKMPRNRPNKGTRDGRLYLDMKAELWLAKQHGKPLSDADLYRLFARKLEMSEANVKAIYLAQRRKLDKQD